MNLLLTGGTGYIGSHTAVVLAEAGHRVVLFDNLSNSQIGVVDRLETILGQRPIFVQGDIRDGSLLERVLTEYAIDAVVHFAGLKSIGESMQMPLTYFDNNINGTLSLITAMQAQGIKNLVFSSSATVYGDPHYLPVDEIHPTSATNPYGRSKLHIEQMLADIAKSNSEWRVACLRYFNPVGAHQSGLIGETPQGVPSNLLPYLLRVADGTLPHLQVFGNDYPTPDGTGVRDFIHVIDLAEGHLAALDYLGRAREPFGIFNLGTGQGCSVLELIRDFEAVTGIAVPFQFVPRRAGDMASVYAKVEKSENLLKWRAKKSVKQACVDAWGFQKLNTFIAVKQD